MVIPTSLLTLSKSVIITTVILPVIIDMFRSGCYKLKWLCDDFLAC